MTRDLGAEAVESLQHDLLFDGALAAATDHDMDLGSQIVRQQVDDAQADDGAGCAADADDDARPHHRSSAAAARSRSAV